MWLADRLSFLGSRITWACLVDVGEQCQEMCLWCFTECILSQRRWIEEYVIVVSISIANIESTCCSRGYGGRCPSLDSCQSIERSLRWWTIHSRCQWSRKQLGRGQSFLRGEVPKYPHEWNSSTSRTMWFLTEFHANPFHGKTTTEFTRSTEQLLFSA